MCQQGWGSHPGRPSFSAFISFQSNQIKPNQIKKENPDVSSILECKNHELDDFFKLC